MESTTTILNLLLKFIWKNILLILFSLAGLFFIVILKKTTVLRPEIVFLDVGQGDGILIQQDNYQIVIDGGADDSVLYKLGKHLPWYDKKIERLILTHPHQDHLEGLLLILKKYEVEEVWFFPVEYDYIGYEYLLKEYETLLRPTFAGDYIHYKDIYGAVLFPFEDNPKRVTNVNNASIVMIFTINGYKILMMGDAEMDVEKNILEYSFLRNIDILKAGHHCSDTSTSGALLSFTQPSIAVCSCGILNKFGHPSYETLGKFEKANVQYLITYEEGDMEFVF